MKKYWEYLGLVWLALIPWGTVLIIRSGVVEYDKVLLYGTEVLFWVIFVVGLWQRYIPKPAYDWRLGLVGIWLIVSLVWTTDMWLAWQWWRWFLLMAGMVWWLSKSEYQLSRQLLAVGVGFIPVIGLGMAQFWLQTSWGSKWLGLATHLAIEPGASVVVGEFGRWLRAYGSFPHPNILGGYLVLLILISALGIKLEQYRWFWLWLGGLSSVMLILTFSRSAWLGLLLALIVGWNYFRDDRLRIWIGVVSLVTVITVGLMWPLIIGRTQVIGAQEQRSVSERVSGWRDALQVWRTQPWLGVGAGNYTVALQRTFPGAPSWTYQPVHNLGLLVLAEFGLIGLGIILAGLGRMVIVVERPWWWVAPLAVIGLFDHYFLTLYPGWLLLGLWLGLWTKIVHR